MNHEQFFNPFCSPKIEGHSNNQVDNQTELAPRINTNKKEN